MCSTSLDPSERNERSRRHAKHNRLRSDAVCTVVNGAAFRQPNPSESTKSATVDVRGVDGKGVILWEETDDEHVVSCRGRLLSMRVEQTTPGNKIHGQGNGAAERQRKGQLDVDKLGAGMRMPPTLFSQCLHEHALGRQPLPRHFVFRIAHLEAHGKMNHVCLSMENSGFRVLCFW